MLISPASLGQGGFVQIKTKHTAMRVYEETFMKLLVPHNVLQNLWNFEIFTHPEIVVFYQIIAWMPPSHIFDRLLECFFQYQPSFTFCLLHLFKYSTFLLNRHVDPVSAVYTKCLMAEINPRAAIFVNSFSNRHTGQSFLTVFIFQT